MSTEIHNNFQPKIAQHIDGRLKSVATVAELPDPTDAANFIYEGAVAYVTGLKRYYKCELVSSVLTWVVYDADALVIGEINITAATSVLDLSLVSPSINECYAVQVNITNGTGATIQSIANMPSDDKLITFFTAPGTKLSIKHYEYDIAGPDQVVLENGFDMVITGREIGNESLTLKKHGVALCQWDATQFIKKSEWLTNLISIAIDNTLTSTKTDEAASANVARLLNESIATKSNKLDAGEKITLIPGATETDNITINSVARAWQLDPSLIPDNTTSAETYITSLYTGSLITSIEYRYVDLRDVAGSNLGLWMLPPSKDASLIGSWVQLDLPFVKPLSSQYAFDADNSLDTQTLQSNTMYHPKILVDSLVGDELGLRWNSDGDVNEKVSFAVSSPGTYEIEIDLGLQAETGFAAIVQNFDLLLYQTDGAQLATNPINTGTVVQRSSYPTFTSAAITKYASEKIRFMVEVVNVGTDNGFTVVLYNATTADFANMLISSYGTLKITKIS